MASGIIGNDVPRKGLRVRVPCPPLSFTRSGTTLRYCVASPQTVEALKSTKPLAETQREANGQKMVGQKDNSLSVLDLFGDHVGPFRVRRGGSWFFEAEYCRSACRPRLDPSFRFDDCGFRVALSSPSGIPGSP